MISGLAGFAASALLAVTLWWLNSRTELTRTELLIDAQADQTRYPDLVRAAGDFATEMRRLNKVHLEHEADRDCRLADDFDYHQGRDVFRDEPTAEVRLLTLEFFADDSLRGAAQAWLEAFYVAWYDKATGSRPEGTKGPFERLEDAEAQYVVEVRRILKVAEPARR